LEKLGLQGIFQGLVTPDDCGARKPSPKIFAYALNLLGVQAREALMIGDNFEADIEPAIALGMKTFHVSQFEAGRTIRSAFGAA
jgi:putative hydrolase of the HAD superfamily